MQSSQLTSEQQSAILELCINRIDDDTFCTRYGISLSEIPREVNRMLEQALATQDRDLVEYALLVGAHFSFSESVSSLIQRLVVQPWHIRHEDMIKLLQERRSISSVPFIQQAIRLKPQLAYLDYDDNGAYYKKCLWALTAIGDKTAIAAIKTCANSTDEMLREQAVDRLCHLGDH